MIAEADPYNKFREVRRSELPTSAPVSARVEVPGGGYWIDHVQVYTTGFRLDVGFLLPEKISSELIEDFDQREGLVDASVSITVDDQEMTAASPGESLAPFGHSHNPLVLETRWWVGLRPQTSLSVSVRWPGWLDETVDLDISAWPAL